MRTLSASEGLEIQNPVGSHSDNANFECQQGAWNAEFNREPQRECEFRVAARVWKCRIYDGTTTRTNASKGLEILNPEGNHSENANFEYQQGD